MTREKLIAMIEAGGCSGLDVAIMKELGLEYDGEVLDSLDAALALVERVRPKAWIEINGPRKYLNIPTPVPNYWKAIVAPWEDKTEGVGWAAAPAAALIAALLKSTSEP